MRNSAVVRMGLMAVLLAGLLFPLMMIYGLVSERAGRRAEAAAEISEQWGGAQTIAGPVLSVGFSVTTIGNDGKPRTSTDRACFLLRRPQDRDRRRARCAAPRAVFEVIVYRARLKMTGRFPPLDFSQWRVQPSDIIRTSATLTVGVSDPRGIAGPIALTWDGHERKFVPGAPRARPRPARHLGGSDAAGRSPRPLVHAVARRQRHARAALRACRERHHRATDVLRGRTRASSGRRCRRIARSAKADSPLPGPSRITAGASRRPGRSRRSTATS